MLICPASGRMKLSSMRMVVVFPAPLGPRKPKISPCAMSKLRFFTPRLPWYVFVTPRMDTATDASGTGTVPTLGEHYLVSPGAVVECPDLGRGGTEVLGGYGAQDAEPLENR